MGNTTITWERTEAFEWTFRDEDLADMRDPDGDLRTDELDSVLADLEGDDEAYQHTPDREVTGITREEAP